MFVARVDYLSGTDGSVEAVSNRFPKISFSDLGT